MHILAQSRQLKRDNLSKKQKRLDKETLNKLKKSSPSPIKGVQFDNEDLEGNTQKITLNFPPKNDKGMNKQYGSFLKQQMSLQKLNGNDQLAKSRKLDIQNANYLKQKYPFGFEGVKACQDVIEKYKASNYIINRGMLQEFEKKAEEYRRNRMNKYKQSQQNQQLGSQVRFTEPLRNYDSVPNQIKQLNKFSYKDQQQDSLKKRIEKNGIIKKETEKKNRKNKKQEGYLLRQKENLIKVGNMLRQIDHKIKQNSSKLSSELKDFKEYLRQQNEEAKYKKVDQKKLSTIIQKISRNSASCSKIPVIMYNNIIDPKLRYNQSTFLPSRINRSEFKPKYTEIEQVVKILRKNQNRLKMLTQNSSFIDQMKSDISF